MGWPLRVVFLVAVGVVILHNFVFLDRPELFPSASRLWELAYLLSLAWVASIVFFYINVHQKAVREKEGLRPFLYTYTRRVVEDAMNIVLNFKRAIDEDIDSEAANTDYEGLWPSLEETQRMCAAINRVSQAPQFAGTWVEFLAFQKRRTEDECSRIYTATPFTRSRTPAAPHRLGELFVLQLRTLGGYLWICSPMLDTPERRAEVLLKRIHRGDVEDGAKTRDIWRRGWSRLGTAGDLAEAIAVLEGLGWVRREEVKPNDGGRPSEILRLHPEFRE